MVDGLDTGDLLIIDYTDMPFLCYHGSVRRNGGMWGSREISSVIYGISGCGMIFVFYLWLGRWHDHIGEADRRRMLCWELLAIIPGLLSASNTSCHYWDYYTINLYIYLYR